MKLEELEYIGLVPRSVYGDEVNAVLFEGVCGDSEPWDGRVYYGGGKSVDLNGAMYVGEGVVVNGRYIDGSSFMAPGGELIVFTDGGKVEIGRELVIHVYEKCTRTDHGYTCESTHTDGTVLFFGARDKGMGFTASELKIPLHVKNKTRMLREDNTVMVLLNPLDSQEIAIIDVIEGKAVPTIYFNCSFKYRTL